MFRPLLLAVTMVMLGSCTVGGGLPPGTLIRLFTAEPNAIVIGMGSGSVMMKWDVALEASAMITPAPGAVVNRGEQAMSPVTTTTFTLTATSSEGSETKSITVYVWENDPYPNDFIREAHETLVAEVTAAGLNPFAFKLDPTDGTQKHAEYCVTNMDTPGFFCGHDENPALPGFTEEGDLAAQSMIPAYVRGHDFGTTIQGALLTLFHRLPLLNVDREFMYLGYASRVSARGTTEGYLGLTTGFGMRENIALKEEVIYPVEGQILGWGTFGGWFEDEVPSPFIEPGPHGVPFTWTLTRFSESHRVQLVEAVVTKSGIPQPLAPLTVFAQEVLQGLNTAGVIPDEPLTPNATYTVMFRVLLDGRERTASWSAIYRP